MGENLYWKATENDDVFVYSEDQEKEDKIKLRPQFRYFKKGKLYAIQWRVTDNDNDCKQLMKVFAPTERKFKRERKKDII